MKGETRKPKGAEVTLTKTLGIGETMTSSEVHEAAGTPGMILAGMKVMETAWTTVGADTPGMNRPNQCVICVTTMTHVAHVMTAGRTGM